MMIKEQIKYLITLLNISTDSEVIIKDITSELVRLRDGIAFITFVKGNFESYSYYPPYQKFLMLLKEYKKIEDEAFFQFSVKNEVEKYREVAEGICEKLRLYRNDIYRGKGDSYFSLLELDLLPCRSKDLIMFEKYPSALVELILKRQEDKLRAQYSNERPKKELTFNFEDNKKMGYLKNTYKEFTK